MSIFPGRGSALVQAGGQRTMWRSATDRGLQLRQPLRSLKTKNESQHQTLCCVTTKQAPEGDQDGWWNFAMGQDVNISRMTVLHQACVFIFYSYWLPFLGPAFPSFSRNLSGSCWRADHTQSGQKIFLLFMFWLNFFSSKHNTWLISISIIYISIYITFAISEAQLRKQLFKTTSIHKKTQYKEDRLE